MSDCYHQYDNSEEVISVAQVGPLSVAELWHGPTGAFKDLALTITSRIVNFLLKKRDKRSVVMVSTSGDTGGAAIHSVLGMDRIHLMVMYPRGMVSRTQELQMTTVIAPNVKVFCIDGSSDEGDVVMTNVFADTAFSKKHNLNVFNSLNICRVLVQAVHFVYLYLQQCPAVDQHVLFGLPTGGMGNLSSGMLARAMGLPVKFLAAVNDNDTVYQTFETGIFKHTFTVHKTLSSAMDISVPYNMERVLYYLCGEDPDTIRGLMDTFKATGLCKLPPSIMASVSTCIKAECVLGPKVLSTIKEMWGKYGYSICPHTAVATRAMLDLLQGRESGLVNESSATTDCKKMVVVGTATAAKFSEAAKEAGISLSPSSAYEALHLQQEKQPFRMNKGENWAQIMRSCIETAWD